MILKTYVIPVTGRITDATLPGIMHGNCKSHAPALQPTRGNYILSGSRRTTPVLTFRAGDQFGTGDPAFAPVGCANLPPRITVFLLRAGQ